MFRFLKNKRKYTYPEIKIPEGCREMTEEEKLLVNGGRKAKDETVVTVENGDTLSELTAKLNEQNGTDYTYEEIALLNGITDPDTIYAGQTIVFPGTRQPESGSDSGSSGDTPSSPSSSNSTNDATANTVKGPEHRSAHDQKYINEMMGKDRKNALGGNRILGNAVTEKKVEEKKINVNQDTGNMNVSDYIAKQRKLGTGTTVSGQTIGREFVKENTASVKAMSGTTINANGHSHQSGKINDSEDTICWDQVGAGALDMILGIGGIVGGGFMVAGTTGGAAPMGYLAASEGITLFCYGMAEFGSGFQGKRIPNSLDLTVEQYSYGLAETDFDRWGQ